MTHFASRLFAGRLFAGQLWRGRHEQPTLLPTTGVGGVGGRRVRKRTIVLPSVRRDRDDDVLLFLLK